MIPYIARWDLDKTYLRTEFDTLRDLVRTAFEPAEQKQTVPGASTLLREIAATGASIHILSGSPEQLRAKLEEKLRLDGARWDTFTLKPNLRNVLRLRFRAVRDQLGYKLPALLGARAKLSSPRRPERRARERSSDWRRRRIRCADLLALRGRHRRSGRRQRARRSAHARPGLQGLHRRRFALRAEFSSTARLSSAS